jgi:hypothetical protein
MPIARFSEELVLDQPITERAARSFCAHQVV